MYYGEFENREWGEILLVLVKSYNNKIMLLTVPVSGSKYAQVILLFL